MKQQWEIANEKQDYRRHTGAYSIAKSLFCIYADEATIVKNEISGDVIVEIEVGLRPPTL